MNLNIEDAYIAMIDFLEKYYQGTNSDDIGSLLSDMILIKEETTADPATWNDWGKSTNKIKNKK